MVNKSTNPTKTKSNTMNSVLIDNKPQPKTRQQIYSENYQKNKEKKKAQQKQRYQQDKERIKTQKKINYAKKKRQAQLKIQQQSAQYYQAEAIKILMPFKEYTELNKEKRKLWQDFQWTLQDCQRSFSEGYADVVMIMKLAQVADNLIRDYRATAKTEEKQRSKVWNNLDYDEQQQLIRYWSYEKARTENGYLDEAERLEQQSQSYLKELELAKFHEQRGKLKCECYACAEQKEIREGVIKQREKILADYEKKQKVDKADKELCLECQKWVKELDEESEVCKKCVEKYG